MSATYRIEVRKEDDETMYSWVAMIYAVRHIGTTDWPVRAERASTPDAALGSARQWVFNANTDAYPKMFYVDDQGRDAEAPQSVKV